MGDQADDLRQLIAVLAGAMGVPKGFGSTRAPAPYSLGRIFPDTPGIPQVDSDAWQDPGPVPLERWAEQQ